MGNLENILKKLREESPEEAAKREINEWHLKEEQRGPVDIPNYIVKMYKEYKDGGGECPNVVAFLNDIAGYLKYKKITGKDVVEWDKTEGPESE
jgi:hypothetical protein